MEVTYFKKCVKNQLCLKLLKVMKFTLVDNKIPHTDNSVGDKPLASTDVAVRFKQFITVALSLTDLPELENIREVYCNHAESDLITIN